VPTICKFFGIIIRMYFRDHAPPHFHVHYGRRHAEVRISPLGVLEGELPPRAWSMVREWARAHKHELLENWERCATGQTPKRIKPLE
jgi:hypothetical protein